MASVMTWGGARILSLKPDLKPFEIKTILYWMFQAVPIMVSAHVVDPKG